MKRRGKSSPAHGRPCGRVNPDRSNTVWYGICVCSTHPRGGNEPVRQRSAQIDDHSRQNSAYRSTLLYFKQIKATHPAITAIVLLFTVNFNFFGLKNFFCAFYKFYVHHKSFRKLTVFYQLLNFFYFALPLNFSLSHHIIHLMHTKIKQKHCFCELFLGVKI